MDKKSKKKLNEKMKQRRNEEPTILLNYLDYLLAVRSYSPKTVETERLSLLEFFSFIKEYKKIEVSVKEFNIFIISSVKGSDVLAYLSYLNTSKNNAAQTRKRKLVFIRVFYKWLLNFNYDICENKTNPAKNIPPIQLVQKLPKVLNLEQAKSILGIYTINNSKMPERNNAIISIFLNCGLRISELINLKIDDANFKDRYFRILGKGNKERIVYYNNNVERIS